MSETVLYDFWRSSASYRVRIALNLAGIKFRAVSVDLVKGDHKSNQHIGRNPQGLVPVLDIDGCRFTQSLAIIEYLDTTRALGLLPKNPKDRARVQALSHAIAIDIHPVCNLSVVTHVNGLCGNTEGTRKDWMRHFILPGLQAFEELLKGFDQSRFCAGDAPGLADLCLFPQLYNADRWGADYSRCERILGVAEACAHHPAFQAAHSDAVRPGA